jgi:hypothetical protein
MAQQGLFGNQYQQAIVDEQNLRRQSAQTGGLTGWAAITNAMSGIGSEIGYQGGQMLGGQTPAQIQQANFQAVINSVPDFDPMNPESLQKMSSAMWKGGFYNEGMNLLNTSQSMLKDNALIDLYAAQAEDERRVKAGPDTRTNSKKLYDEQVAEGTVTSTFKAWLDTQDLTNDEKLFEAAVADGSWNLDQGGIKDFVDRNVKEDVVEAKDWKFSDVPSQLRADIETQVKKIWDYGAGTLGGIDTDYKWKDMVTQVYFISKNLGITPYDLLNNPITVDGTERRVTDTDIMKNWRTVFNVSSSIAGTGDPEGGFEEELTK